MSWHNGSLMAHAGGWDEVLLVVAPIALFGGLLWLAQRRAKERMDQLQQLTDDEQGAD